jgi:ribonuclease HI
MSTGAQRETYHELHLQFDGGSRGNPGLAGIGVTITTPDGRRVYELGDVLEHATNNVAEYTALVRGIQAARQFGAKKLHIRADSELVVRQINGQYRVKSPDLKPLYTQAVRELSFIPDWSISHVYRESNSRADQLANLAMDKRRKFEKCHSEEAAG